MNVVYAASSPFRGPVAILARSSQWLGLLFALTLYACAAVYPEIAAPMRPVPPNRELSPPPPDDLLYIAFDGAEIPNRTRDGRQWDSIGGDAPDPFAQVFMNDEELIKTPIQTNTLKPTWPDQKRANYRVPSGAAIRVELWDSNPINNHPICSQRINNIHEESAGGTVELVCDSGARLKLRVEPAHAQFGLGFYYELRTSSVFVSRVLTESPAGRAGLKKGEEITQVMQKKTSDASREEVQSLINANAQLGVKLMVKGSDGQEREVVVKEGPIYPLVNENVPLS